MYMDKKVCIPIVVALIAGSFGLVDHVLPCYVFDEDGDSIHDCHDDCSNAGCLIVDAYGCPKDSDLDGLEDCNDDCHNPGCAIVDVHGCPKDSDLDGLEDCNDDCHNPGCAIVDVHGCPKDSDLDGLEDCNDDCPLEKGEILYNGCPAPEKTLTTVEISFVNYDAEGENDDTNLNGEWVEICNTGDHNIDMTGWKLHDANGHVFNFPYGFVLKAGKSVRIYTGSGKNKASELYWGRNKSVWNNDRDCAYLVDDQGNAVAKYCWE